MKIKDIGKVVTGKTPQTSHPEYYNGEYMFVTPNELHRGYRITSSEKRITEAGLNSIKSNTIDGISVLVGCIGWDMGNVSMCFEKCASNQQINSIINIKELYNPYFLYYWFSTKKNYLFSIASVTRTPILSKGVFEDIEIPDIARLTQDKIVDVLLSIDKKIEINKKINDNLQQQLKLMYDYWFTQFDFPNENGKPYHSSGGAMAWDESLKRNIPQGWEVKPLSELCDILLGGTPSTGIPEYWNGNINWLNSGEVAQFPVVNSAERITQKGLENSPAKLMPKGTTIVSITGNIRTSYLAIDTCANQSVVGVLEIDMMKYPFLYQYLSRLISRFTAISTGNCQQHINKGAIEDALVVVPDNAVLTQYYQITTPLYESISKSALENQQLIQLRDWLLPMLMNGQATITD